MTVAVTATADVTRAISAYADRFHGAIDARHHVASPLGAWMLLALCARASEGRRRDALRAALGLEVDRAADVAATLLSTPQQAVSAAAAVWNRAGVPAEALAPWLARLPVSVDRGELPSQLVLDAWAKRHTLGLIDQFPQGVAPLTAFLLATAVATRVTWDEPFQTVPSRELDPHARGDWPGRVQRALRSLDQPAHLGFIAATARAGDVAVHSATAKGLSVTSVIAERDVRRADVIGTAYELATDIACRRPVEHRSLFDLPLGDSPLWTIEEQQTETSAPNGREERCMAVLPAWAAEGCHALARDDLGFPAVAETLAGLAGLDRYDYEALQSVVARYSRTGFEAAAITAVSFTMALSRPQPPGLLRIAMLRFGHPYAVVATALDQPTWERSSHAVRYGPWHGIPVFSAWVAEPSEADEECRPEDFTEEQWIESDAIEPPESLADGSRAPIPEGPRSRALELLRRFRLGR